MDLNCKANHTHIHIRDIKKKNTKHEKWAREKNKWERENQFKRIWNKCEIDFMNRNIL